MIGYLLHDDAGVVFQFMDLTSGTLPPAPEGYRWTPCPAPALNWRPQPDGDGGFTAAPYVAPAEMQLRAAKDDRLQAAGTARDRRIAAGCVSSFGLVDADDQSRTNVLGAVALAQIAKQAGAPFERQWRMYDNAYLTLDADQMIALGIEVGSFVGACYSASFAAKDAIEAAATLEEVAAVDVTAGYP
jgi:hypothetical protein